MDLNMNEQLLSVKEQIYQSELEDWNSPERRNKRILRIFVLVCTFPIWITFKLCYWAVYGFVYSLEFIDFLIFGDPKPEPPNKEF